jgi:hypothetical protein
VIGDPRDKSGYGVSLATLGLALGLLIAGICWVVVTQQHTDSTHTTLEICRTADHCVVSKAEVLSQPSTVPDGLWIALAALGGILVGTLIPLSPLTRRSDRRAPTCNWPVYALLVLAAVIVVLVVNPVSTQLILTAGFAGLLLGLLIPSPAGEG